MPKLKNILLIDDDEITNFIGSDLITAMDIAESVSIAGGGQEALDYMKKACQSAEGGINVPELIFLDMNMPGMDGLGFLEKINSVICQTSYVPVIIMLSTSFLKEDIAKAFKMNPMVKDYFEKPLTTETVMKVYNTYFTQKEGVRSQESEIRNQESGVRHEE